MTSKKLGALMRSVPPATAIAAELDEAPMVIPDKPALPEPASQTRTVVPTAPVPVPAVTPPPGQGRAPEARAAAAEHDVSLQIVVPARVRKELALYCTNRSETLRTVMLQAIRGLGIEVSDAEIVGKRGRKTY
jgi:hypothetical protein